MRSRKNIHYQNLGHHPNSLLFYMTNTMKMIMMTKEKMTTIIDSRLSLFVHLKAILTLYSRIVIVKNFLRIF